MPGGLLELLREGYRSQQAGDLARAEQIYRRALDLDPANLYAQHLLGVLCEGTGRTEEAIDRLRSALAAGGDNAEAHAALGRAHASRQEFQEAAEHFRKAAALNPRDAVVLNDLGVALRMIERPLEAITTCEAALKLEPDSAAYWVNLAAAHEEANRHERGLLAVECALKLDPQLTPAWSIKADLLLGLGRHAEAIEWYQRCLALDPKYVHALLNTVRALRDSGDVQGALVTLRKAIEIDPKDSESMVLLGRLREQLGEFDAAAESFCTAIRLAPRMGAAHYQLAQLKGRRSTDEELAAMSALWERDDLLVSSRISVAFGLYRALEQRSQFDDAFRFLVAGNRLSAEGYPYDDGETSSKMEAMAVEAEAAIARLGRSAGHPGPRPVFVLGMPRSGTTLTEQILASHSEIFGAGELTYVSDTIRLARDLTGQTFPKGLAVLTAEQLRQLGQYYMSRHAPSAPERRYVVDKTPMNYEHIGLLALALPEARFIHCRRHPVASCFAIYRMPFERQHAYAHELTAVGRHYTHYTNLMKHWHAIFPGRILDVCYEDTVADLERQSRRMLEFLDLPFEEDVLRYYATKRLVKTPSASQVRQPIYTDSLDSWKNYERHLAPLIEALQVPLRDFEGRIPFSNPAP